MSQAPAQSSAAASEPPQFEDDPKLIDTALERLRKCAKTGKTKAYAFRIAQLKQLHKGLRTMKKDLS